MHSFYRSVGFLLPALFSMHSLWAQLPVCDSLIGTGASQNNLPNGTYTVEVTDGNGCTQQGTVYVTTTYNFSLSVAVQQNNGCTTNNQGQASVSASGPGPFTYHWSSGSNSATATNLASGTHTVTVTNSTGCQQTASVFISKSSLTLSANSLLSNDCTGPNQGNIEAYTPNGSPPYTYLWNTGSTQMALNNMPNGTYTVTVTDNTGCSASASGNIVTYNDLTATASMLTANTCISNNQGAVTVYASGGEPLTYAWSTGSTNQTVYNLPNGTYTVTVTNSNGCTRISSTTVEPDNNIVLSISTNQRNTCTTHNQGSLSVSAIAGTPFTAYHWSNGATTASITGLDNGIYTVTVTNSSGCTLAETTNLYANNGLTIFYSTVQNNQCPATQQGQVTASAVGQSPFTYRWYRQSEVTAPTLTANGQWLSSSPGNTYQWYRNGILLAGATAQTYYATQPGTYTVVVTNTAGCPAESNAQVITIISGLTDTALPTASISPNPALGLFTVTVPVPDADILVHDLSGRQLMQVKATQPDTRLQIETSGIYLITVKTPQASQTLKLVVNR